MHRGIDLIRTFAPHGTCLLLICSMQQFPSLSPLLSFCSSAGAELCSSMSLFSSPTKESDAKLTIENTKSQSAADAELFTYITHLTEIHSAHKSRAAHKRRTSLRIRFCVTELKYMLEYKNVHLNTSDGPLTKKYRPFSLGGAAHFIPADILEPWGSWRETIPLTPVVCGEP